MDGSGKSSKLDSEFPEPWSLRSGVRSWVRSLGSLDKELEDEVKVPDMKGIIGQRSRNESLKG